RKAYLLEDKQIPTLEWNLEEIHVTWAHLEKKQTRLQLYTKVNEEKGTQWLETALQFLATVSGRKSDIIKIFATALEHNRLNETLDDSAG
ncbi:hypothetical protein Tco_1074983, partial [Tanacetum coccineum]